MAYKCCKDVVVGWMNERPSRTGNMPDATVEGDQEPDSRRGVKQLTEMSSWKTLEGPIRIAYHG